MKIREIFCENPRIIFVLFNDVHKENMFTINLEDGREAPSKARKKCAKRLEFLVYINLACLSVFCVCLFFCGTSRDHREGLWMIKILKCAKKNIIISANFYLFICFMLYKEKMLTDKAFCLLATMSHKRTVFHATAVESSGI